jgi:hypothetical protein
MTINWARYRLAAPRPGVDTLAFRALHWLVSPGSSEMARLRGYLRVKQWRQCRSIRERAHILKLGLKLPARAARDSYRAIHAHGEIARREGVSSSRQFLHLIWLRMKHGVHPETYYSFCLFRRGRMGTAPLFMQGDEDDDLYRLLNHRTAPEDAERLVDKLALEEWLRKRGLPTVRTLVICAGGSCTLTSVSGERLPPIDLFSKPRDSVQGIGAKLWRYNAGVWRSGSDAFSRDELLSHLATGSVSRPILLQETLRSHCSIAALSPGALSTVRLLTLRAADGQVTPIIAVLKMPVGAAATDHFRKGAVGAPVDLETGRLGLAMVSTSVGYIKPIACHPDSGIQVAGFQLPLWTEARDLAVAAHESLPKIVCVGWDVAITDYGPVIIEGNDNPGHRSMQLPTGVAIGSTADHVDRVYADRCCLLWRSEPAPSDSGTGLRSSITICACT